MSWDEMREIVKQTESHPSQEETSLSLWVIDFQIKIKYSKGEQVEGNSWKRKRMISKDIEERILYQIHRREI